MKALGLKVQHSSRLTAGFDKVLRPFIFLIIPNNGSEGVQAANIPALLPLLGGSAGPSSPHGCEGGRQGGKLTDKRKVRGRKMLGMCFLI